MQDELLMREWTALHDDFVAGLKGRREPSHGSARDGVPSFDMIGSAYHPCEKGSGSGNASVRLSPAARASLRGFAASVITVLLWMTLMALATPASGPTLPPEARATYTASAHAYPALA